MRGSIPQSKKANLFGRAWRISSPSSAPPDGGKSTLLQYRRRPPGAGVGFGADLRPAAPRAESRGRHLFQADALFPWKTALDKRGDRARGQGGPRATALEAAQRWLTSVGLGAFGARYPHMLSAASASASGSRKC